MSELSHWHPALLSGALRRRPVPIQLCGRELVLFRDADGKVGALADRCPHRRMRLSDGKVEDGRLVCPYHGWSFSPDGSGRSPANPKLTPCADALEAEERHGAIWVRERGSQSELPRFDIEGYQPLRVLEQRVKAPLEVVLDNFCEVEHTPSVHALLGYDPRRTPEIDVRVETTESSVRVINRGPQKKLPWVIERLFVIRTGDCFIDDWTTWFSPVYCVYDQWWEDAATGEARPDRLRIYVFFNPIGPMETQLITFAYSTAASWSRLGSALLYRPLLEVLIRLEVHLDLKLVERIADPRTELKGMQLSRFDKPLGENRRRLEQIYRGQST